MKKNGSLLKKGYHFFDLSIFQTFVGNERNVDTKGTRRPGKSFGSRDISK